MLYPTGAAYFQALYDAIGQSFRQKEKTSSLCELLEEISVDIRDISDMTMAGKYASEGQINIAKWCHDTLGASTIFIVEGLIRGSRGNPKLEQIAVDWCESYAVNPIAPLRGYAFIGNAAEVNKYLEKHFKSDMRQDWTANRVRQELAVSAILGDQFGYYKTIQEETEKTKKSQMH